MKPGYPTDENEIVYFKRYPDSEGNVDIDAALARARKWASLEDFSIGNINDPT